ncbi:MAG: hypothetical protein C4293_18120 [Nitrospiraceae bacterium]
MFWAVGTLIIAITKVAEMAGPSDGNCTMLETGIEVALSGYCKQIGAKVVGTRISPWTVPVMVR